MVSSPTIEYEQVAGGLIGRGILDLKGKIPPVKSIKSGFRVFPPFT